MAPNHNNKRFRTFLAFPPSPQFLKSIQQPFSFYERDQQRQMLKEEYRKVRADPVHVHVII